jgi:hypothetical protein
MFNITTVVFDGISPPFIEGGRSVILVLSLTMNSSGPKKRVNFKHEIFIGRNGSAN